MKFVQALSHIYRKIWYKKLNEWLYKTDRYNYITNFNRVFETNFYTFEKSGI